MRIGLLTGTRPDIIKMAPLIKGISSYEDIEPFLIHSGQHYDYDLFEGVYQNLGLPKPDINLDCGKNSESISDLVSNITTRLSHLQQKECLDAILVHGDTATAIGGALASAFSRIPLCHVEAGVRTHDIYGNWEKFLPWPESLCGRIVDICSDFNFAPSKTTFTNLRMEKLKPQTIFWTGNTIVDSISSYLSTSKESDIIENLGIDQDIPLIVFSIHRRENILNSTFLEEITKILLKNPWKSIIYWSIHRITQNKLKEMGLWSEIESAGHIIPQSIGSYTSFLQVLFQSDLILTDSSTLQEEAITLKKPCVTCRKLTDRMETVEAGGNIVATNPKEVEFWATKILQDEELYEKMRKTENPYGPPRPWKSVTESIINILLSKLNV